MSPFPYTFPFAFDAQVTSPGTASIGVTATCKANRIRTASATASIGVTATVAARRRWKALSTTLLDYQSQKSGSGLLMCKVVLVSGSTRYGYIGGNHKPSNVKIHHYVLPQTWEKQTPDSHKANIYLDNQDDTFLSLDFKGYTVYMAWGYHTGVTRSAWATGTSYSVGDVVVPITANGLQYRCVTAGTSHAATEPTWTTAIGAQYTDNTVTWECDGYAGDEYRNLDPFCLDDMYFSSTPDNLICVLPCFGIPDLLSQEVATSTYLPDDIGIDDKDWSANEDKAAGQSTLLIHRAYSTHGGLIDGSYVWYQIKSGTTFTIEGDSTVYTLTAAAEVLAPSDCSEIYTTLHFSPVLAADVHSTDEVTLITDADNNTHKDYIDEILAGASHGFSPYDAITAGWDSEDSLIDVLKTGTSYRVSLGNSRWNRLNWLLNYTKEVCRPGYDGKLHFKNPAVSGTVYDYEYTLPSGGSHTFFAKTYLNPTVKPNSIIVRNYDDTFGGGASTSGRTRSHTVVYPVLSDAQGNLVAAAVLQRATLDSQQGHITVPMINVAQEVWDYIKVTDAREAGTARTGNVQYIKRSFDGMKLGFGGSGHLPGSAPSYRSSVEVSEEDSYLYGVLDDLSDTLQDFKPATNGDTGMVDSLTEMNEPTQPKQVANKLYVDGTIAEVLKSYLALAGGIMAGNIDMNEHSIFVPTYPNATGQQGSIQVSTLAWYWYAAGAWHFAIED